MTRTRLRRRLLRGAASMVLLCAAGCQAFLETGEESKRDLGWTCDDGAQCLSGFCTDGYCCDSTCDGACRSCEGRKTAGGVDGECEAIVPSWSSPEEGC